jgi:uncharacterized phage-associated protein
VKSDRLANVVLYLLRGCPRPGLTKLLKLIYFVDFFHYQLHLATVSGASYVALERGPAVDGYEQAFAEMKEKGYIDVLNVPVVGHDTLKQEYVPRGEADENAFTAEERDTLDFVMATYGRKTGRNLSKLTHREWAPWKLVWDKRYPGRPIPQALFRWVDNLADERDIEVARERAKRPGVAAALAELGLTTTN